MVWCGLLHSVAPWCDCGRFGFVKASRARNRDLLCERGDLREATGRSTELSALDIVLIIII